MVASSLADGQARMEFRKSAKAAFAFSLATRRHSAEVKRGFESRRSRSLHLAFAALFARSPWRGREELGLKTCGRRFSPERFPARARRAPAARTGPRAG